MINEDYTKVKVFPARCGIGKSTLIQAIVKVFARRKIGIVIITDSKKRLSEVLECEDEKTKEMLSKRVEDFRGRDSFIKHIDKGFHKPVALITTQKYFRLDGEFREKLFNYEIGKKHQGRNIVIFDEKPYFFEILQINIKKLNDISTTLNEGIDSSVQDKKWVVENFEKFIVSMKKRIVSFENEDNQNITFFCRVKTSGFGEGASGITNNDERFFKFLTINKDRIFEYNMETYQDIIAIKKFLQEGGIFESRKAKNNDIYGKSFTVLIDKRDYFSTSNKKVKFFILDATANIDPIYELDYLEMVDCSKYNVKLNLELNIVHERTNKGRLHKVSEEFWVACRKYISRVTNNEKTLVVTYKDKIEELKGDNQQLYCAYFGNLKGFNEYNQLTNMVQIGLNRAPNIVYFYTLCVLEPEYYEELKKDTHEESVKRFRGINTGIKEFKLVTIIKQTVLTDFVQNFYRLSIRHYQNEKKNRVWILFNTDSKEFKLSFIEYEISHEKLGVKVNYFSTPNELSEYKTKSWEKANGQATIAQKVLKWLETQTPGRSFKLREMAKEMNLTIKQVNKVKENHSEIKEKISKMQIKKKFI